MVRMRSIPAAFGAGLLALALCGCGANSFHGDREERDERANVYPATFKADIVGAMRAYLTDPTNIRDAWVADPAVRSVGTQNRYAACLRFNAKNGDGRYTGSRDAMAVFVAGRFDHFIDPQGQPVAPNQPNSPELALVKEQCKDAQLRRFLELEALPR